MCIQLTQKEKLQGNETQYQKPNASAVQAQLIPHRYTCVLFFSLKYHRGKIVILQRHYIESHRHQFTPSSPPLISLLPTDLGSSTDLGRE